VKRVLTAVILIPLVVIALFKAPLWLFTLFVFGVAVLAAHEYFGIVKAQGYRPFEAISYAFVALTYFLAYRIADLVRELPPNASPGYPSPILVTLSLWIVPLLILWGPLLLLLVSLRREPLSGALPDAAMSYMLLPYVAFTLGMLPVMRAPRNGAWFVLYLMLLVWCGDIAAYYVGRAIGKHKLAPRVSPGKSWEGAIASVLGAVFVGWLWFLLPSIRIALVYLPIPGRMLDQLVSLLPPWRFPPPFWTVTLFAICVNVAAQLGDLVESALKRGAGVKDSGTLLPGHGGVLDRIDALLFALPIGLIFYAGIGGYFSAS
jgi:phosphatidate cytidylyltransferase